MEKLCVNKKCGGFFNDCLYAEELNFWSLFLFVAALIYAYPFYTAEYIAYGDALFHMNRIEGIKEALLAFEIPARINGYMLNGYGTADGIMYPNLLLYFPAALRILGVPVALAWNIYWIFIIMLGIFVSFTGYSVWTKNIRAGAVCACFYVSAVCVVFCLGHGAGDYPAFMTLPLAIGSLIKILEDEKNAKYWWVFVIGFTIIIETHVITALFLIILIFILLAFYNKALKNKIQRGAVLKAAFFSCLLNLWFALPFAYFYKTVSFHINNPPSVNSLHDVTSSIYEIVYSQCYLGAPILLFLLVCLFFGKTRKDKCFIVACLIYLLMLFAVSEYFPWEWIENNLPGGKFLPSLQFSLRFIPFGAMFIILYIGNFFAKYAKTSKKYLFAATVFFIYIVELAIASNSPIYFGHNLFMRFDYAKLDSLPSYIRDNYYVAEDYLYSDVIFHKLRNERGEVYGKDEFKSDARVFAIKKQGTRLEFSYNVDYDTVIQVPLFYWEGYEATDENGDKHLITSGENRFMEVHVPKGNGMVKIHYAGLWFFWLCDAISFVAFLAFIFIVTIKERRKENLEISGNSCV